jgi:DNA-binding IclR family transcriptional regulator
MVSMSTQHEDKPQTTGGIKSIEVGARVLFALERGRGPMPLTDVARSAELHPAKVHRYLASLVRTGLASQDPTTGLYDLGPRSRHLGVEALRRSEPVSTVSAHALKLREQTGHTVNTGVWTEHGPTLVRCDNGIHALPIVVRIGSVVPLLDSAVGLVFLAYLPESTTRSELRAQQRRQMTRAATAAEIDELKAETIRDGFSRTINGMVVGYAGLGAPVFGPDGSLEVVIAIILPSSLMTEDDARRLGTQLRAAADVVSGELGHVAEDGLPIEDAAAAARPRRRQSGSRSNGATGSS